MREVELGGFAVGAPLDGVRFGDAWGHGRGILLADRGKRGPYKITDGRVGRDRWARRQGERALEFMRRRAIF